MGQELSFVEVVMKNYQPGDKEFQHAFEMEDSCFNVPWEEATEEIKEVKEAQRENAIKQQEAHEKGRRAWTSLSLGYEPDLLITKSLTSFSFRFFGQNVGDNYVSGLAHESELMDDGYVFESWLEDLKEIGSKLLNDKLAMANPKAKPNSEVRFVTLWKYNWWFDSYNHEYDSDWELIGLVNPYKLEAIVKNNIDK